MERAEVDLDILDGIAMGVNSRLSYAVSSIYKMVTNYQKQDFSF